MAATNLPEVFQKKPGERDLQKIAEAIGKNWEFLGPYLIKKNPQAVIDRIKEDKRGSSLLQIREMLLTWRKAAAEEATYGELFHQMCQAGPSVMIEWGSIADYLHVKVAEIKACKAGYQPVGAQQVEPAPRRPVQVSDRAFGVSETDGPLRRTHKEKCYRQPRDACIFDGRLLELEKEDIDILKHKCTHKFGSGAFGMVYTSKTVLTGYGIPVAVKKIPATGSGGANDRSVRREKIASKIMHPFILPLLAFVDRQYENPPEVWFVSPLCEKGDLHSVIEADHEAIQMNHITRIKILLQISLAIEYIHTAVPHVRVPILHKDICSKNVVLDAYLNARLIDFGLARERDDDTSMSMIGRVYYEHPHFGEKNATESWDYYAFGVVIREMLTGLKPQGLDATFLRKIEAEKILKILQENVWPGNSRAFERAEKLHSIAQECLQNLELGVEGFKYLVVDKIKEIWKHCTMMKLLDVPDDYKQCHICMINPAAKETSMKQNHEDNCTQKISVCIACEKNSFLNPITCYCGTELKPVIGCKWGALLVAGNDTSNTTLASALTKDLTELKQVITSKAPLIMGISDENVRIVVPEKPGTAEELWPKVRDAITHFRSQTNIDTLLIYFSCHGAKGNAEDGKNRFELGSAADCLSLEAFKMELESLQNVDKLIVFLDRCYPPILQLRERKNIIQINACKDDQEAEFNNNGSTFTKYLIQGLKAKSEKSCSEDCDYCKAYWTNSNDFISISSLFEYVKKHVVKKNAPTPEQMIIGSDSSIAFYTDEKVELVFTDKDIKRCVPLEYLRDMKDLEAKLLREFQKENTSTRVKIQMDTYRKRNQLEDCTTIEMVMSAWVGRNPLHVTFY